MERRSRAVTNPRPQGTRYPAKFPVEVTVPEPGVWEAIA